MGPDAPELQSSELVEAVQNPRAATLFVGVRAQIAVLRRAFMPPITRARFRRPRSSIPSGEKI